MPQRAFALVAAACLVAVPGAAQQAQVPDTIRDCMPAELPLRLPGLDALIDSTSVHRAFARVAVKGEPKVLLLSIGFNGYGHVRGSQVLDRNMSVDSAVLIARAVMPLVRKQSESADDWAVRFRITMAETTSFGIERSTYCFPVYDARNSMRASEMITAQPFTMSEVRAGGRTRVRVYVSEGGTVMTVERAQTSGNTQIDEAVLNAYRNARFAPALLDGVPVRGWFDSGRPGARRTAP